MNKRHDLKVLFIFCNNSTDDAISFPLGVGLLASILKNKGYLTRGIYVDFSNFELINFKNMLNEVKLFNPALICYSATSPAFVFVKKVAKYLRQNLDITTICGGMHPTLYPEETLCAEGIDYICVGDGERPLFEFVENINNINKGELSIPGIWKRSPEGKIIKNKLYPLSSDLDDLTGIDYDIFGKEFIDKVAKNGWLRFITSRGCPYNCSYCHNNLIRKAYADGIGCAEKDLHYIRFRSVDLVIKDILEIVNKYKIKVINFMDDLFCLDKKRTLEFCEKFKKRLPYDVGYSIQTHIAHLDKQVVDALRTSRCVRVVIGIESASPRIQEIFNRKMKIELMDRNLSILLDAKFPLGVWTLNILGNPTETKEEMLQTLSFNASHLVDVCKFNFMAPYSGSDIYSFCKKENLFREDYDVQRFENRYFSVLKHNPMEAAFLEKFFDIGHWYMNALSPLGLNADYEPLIAEVEKISVGQWHVFKEKYKKEDYALSRRFYNKGKPHYNFMFQGKIIGKVIGLTRGGTSFKDEDFVKEKENAGFK